MKKARSQRQNRLFFVPGGEVELGNDCPRLAMHVYADEFPIKNKKEVTIIAGGFAKQALNDPVLQVIAEKLKHPAVIFNWHGLGLSEGDFSDVTVAKLQRDFNQVVAWIRLCGYQKINFVLFGVAACFAPEDNKSIPERNKIVFLSPSLNLAYLLRYWWAINKRVKPPTGKKSFNHWKYEKDYWKFVRHEKKFTGGMSIGNQYWLTESRKNYALVPGHSHEGSWYESAVFVFGEDDLLLPRGSSEFKCDNPHKIIKDADCFFNGHEEEVAIFVDRFIRRKLK